MLQFNEIEILSSFHIKIEPVYQIWFSSMKHEGFKLKVINFIDIVKFSNF